MRLLICMTASWAGSSTRPSSAHQQQFQEAGKAINDKVRLYSKIGRALLEARQSGTDAFAAIESVMPWEAFVASVTEAQKLAPSDDFDYLHRVADSHALVRRYAPAFLAALDFSAAPAAQDVLDAVGALRVMYASSSRLLPANAPTAFIRKRWEKLVFTVGGIDVRYYEICALSELRNALRSGDIWVRGSRQFKNFEEYLMPSRSFVALRRSAAWPLAVGGDCDEYLRGRMEMLSQQLETANALAATNDLPDAIITTSGLKITPLDAAVPEAAHALIDQCAGLLPHVKITEVLQEVDAWTDFTRHFTHIKSGEAARDKTLLLTVVLADAVNLGLSKMAESCPGTTPAKLSWLQAWHVRDETYSAALAELVNAQFRQPFAAHCRFLPFDDRSKEVESGERVSGSGGGGRFGGGGRDKPVAWWFTGYVGSRCDVRASSGTCTWRRVFIPGRRNPIHRRAEARHRVGCGKGIGIVAKAEGFTRLRFAEPGSDHDHARVDDQLPAAGHVGGGNGGVRQADDVSLAPMDQDR